MNYLCTLSDYGYIHLGLALYDSLITTSSDDFILYYLTLDDKIYNKLNELNLPKLKLITLNELLENNNELSSYNKSEYREFVWMLASYFSDYLLKNKEVDHITYIDSDIYFYEDIKLFYDEVDGKSVGIIRHRHIPKDAQTPDGKYNVGVVFFKKDQIGSYCLDWWKDAVFYKKYPPLSTCYDQKYLEGFLMMFTENDICVVDKTFSHGAPWHNTFYEWKDYESKKVVIWEGSEHKYLFHHFSRLSFDFEQNTYSDVWNRGWEISQVRQLYDDYFDIIRETYKKYSL
jgi:hypothetical protein